MVVGDGGPVDWVAQGGTVPGAFCSFPQSGPGVSIQRSTVQQAIGLLSTSGRTADRLLPGAFECFRVFYAPSHAANGAAAGPTAGDGAAAIAMAAGIRKCALSPVPAAARYWFQL